MRKLSISGKIKLLLIKNQNGSNAELDVYDTLMGMLSRQPDNRPFDHVQMTKRSKLISKAMAAFDDSKGSILLENSEFDIIKECMELPYFKVCDPGIVAWMDTIIELKEIEVEPKKKKTK